MGKTKTIVGLLALVAFSSACSFSRMASDITSDIFKAGSPIIEEESDIEVSEQAGLAMMKTLEVFHRHNPGNKNYLLLLSKSYATYGFGFLENRMLQYRQSDPEQYRLYETRAKLFYTRGKQYALRYLEKKNRGLLEAMEKGLEPLRQELAGLKQKDVESLFWLALNWGNYINLTKDEVKSVSDLAIVETIMKRITELNPDFFYGGPNLFYGVYYASRPPMLGGNPEEAKKHFEKAEGATKGKFLMVYAIEAQFLAVQMQDKALFEGLLSKIEDASVDVLPEQRLANVLAKERARLLRSQIDSYF
ncbi:MAG: hypothetical protein HYW02_04325 [Deltaproteobacteria bacterium]|nr:hypothetical protein [Deltaproteobacteria bacterium]